MSQPDVLAAISHEIRNGLNGLLGVAELLLATDLDDRQHEHVGTIRECGEGLQSMVADILDLARMESGAFRLAQNPFLPEEVMDHVRRVMGPQAAAKGLLFEVTMESGIRQTVIGDHDRFRQVVINLIANAIKFTDEGKVILRVAGTPLGDSSEIRIDVIDTGCGIAADELQDLFRPNFQTAEGARRGGTGLGLTICQHLVEQMNGRMEVESELGEGSRFRAVVTLPHGPEEAVATPKRPDTDDAPTLSILLAEDNAINRALMETVLTELGHQVETVCDGREAVDYAISGNFDLLMVDIQMPVMDGVQATRAIRQFEGGRSRLPILGLTAHDSPDHKAAFVAAGMDGVVTKPISVTDIAGEIAAVTAQGVDIFQAMLHRTCRR